MKIAIQTVPFNNNYGGFLQAYALKQALLDMGHEVIFVMRRRNRARPHRYRNLVKYLLGKDQFCQFKQEWQIRKLSIHTDVFVNRYLKPWTKEYYTTEELMECRNLDADVFIAGSDQCWRSKFAPTYIDDYYFKYLKGTSRKRISYAASFGTDEFEYSPAMQQSCTELLKEFSAISVRESSGIQLLEDYFGVPEGKAKDVLDPTFLPPISSYETLIKDQPVVQKDYLFTYILDMDEEKREVIDTILKSKKLTEVNQKAQTGDIYKMDPIEPVERWLSRLYHAEFVVTDSFHGTVFCILFNKSFIVYGNKARGATRFLSLLGKFGLEGRYIESLEDLDLGKLNVSIDWNSVNKTREMLKTESLHFLQDAIFG